MIWKGTPFGIHYSDFGIRRANLPSRAVAVLVGNIVLIATVSLDMGGNQYLLFGGGLRGVLGEIPTAEIRPVVVGDS